MLWQSAGRPLAFQPQQALKLYPDAAGVKTGFTDAAGRCLVSYAQRGGVRLIVVTLNCPDDWNEHIKLYEHYFGALTQTAPGEMIPAADLPVTGGTQTYAAVTFEEPEPVALLPGERLDVTVTAELFLYAPVQAGDVVGHALFSVGGQPVADVTLTAADDVAAVKEKRRYSHACLADDGRRIGMSENGGHHGKSKRYPHPKGAF